MYVYILLFPDVLKKISLSFDAVVNRETKFMTK